MKEKIIPSVVAVFLIFNLPLKAENFENGQPLEAFNKLKSLVGIWTKSGSIQDRFQIEFSLTAGGSVLVETWRRNGHVHSLTLYHQDIDKLMATHYCPQGNQPRLSLTGEPSSTALSFTYLDATNLKSIDDSHQHSLSFQLPDKEGSPLVRHESYLSGSGEHKSSLVLSMVNSDTQEN